MAQFKIRAEETVTYEIDVEAETLEAAIELVETGEADDLMEKDSSGFDAIEYALPGQAGWQLVSELK